MLTLRPMSDGDLPIFKTWLSAPHVAEWYHDPSDWILEVEQREGAFNWIYHYILESDGESVGFCQYYACRSSDETWGKRRTLEGIYSIDYLIGERAYLGRGLGKQTVLALIEKIKGHRDAREIVVQPEPGNKPSRATLRACGFFYDPGDDIFSLAL